MLVLLSVILLCLITFLTTLLIISPGKLKSFVDQSGQPLIGSISEKIFMKIGGVKQGMFIRGKDIKNPVLLFVHGGPSFPEYFLVEKYPVGLEDHFTVCYWEQRGGGISYTPDVTLESMTLEQLASDAIEVTNYLCDRFNKEKIYIMAHILPFLNSVLRDKAQHDLGIGTMHNMRSIIKDVFLTVWTCRAYTVKEKFNIWISKFSFIPKSGLRYQIINMDIPINVPRLEIPVYLFSGRYDLTVNKDLSKEYLGKIDAPVKGFYTFNNSAHSPMFEEPQRLKEILIKDVLNRSTTLADN